VIDPRASWLFAMNSFWSDLKRKTYSSPLQKDEAFWVESGNVKIKRLPSPTTPSLST
jgi:hypothetical protein